MRPGGDHGPRPHPGPRHPRRAEARRRRRDHRARPRHRRPRPAGQAPLADVDRRHRSPGSSTAPSCCGRRAGRCSPGSSTPPRSSAPRSPTSRSPSRRSRRCSSTSPGRTCGNDRRHHRHAHRPTPARRARPAAPGAASPTRAPSSPCCSATSTCWASSWFALPGPHDRAAAAAHVRVHLRVPEDRPGRGRRHGQRRVHHHPRGRRVGLAIIFQGIQAVALPLVQEFGVLQGDRGPCPGAAAHQAGRRPEDRDRHAARARSQPPSCSPSPRWCRPRRCTCRSTGSILITLAPLAGLGGRRPRPGVGHPGAAAVRVVPVRPGGAATHVPGRHLLPVEDAASPSAGCRCSCSSTRSCTCARGSAPR